MKPSSPQRQLAGLISEIRSVQLERYEQPGFSAELYDRVLPQVGQVTRRSLETLESLEEQLEGIEAGEESPAWWDRPDAETAALEPVRDLCFIARVEIRPLLEQLERSASHGPNGNGQASAWGPLLQIERVQIALTNGLCAVESGLARLLGRSSETQHVDLLRASLDARRMTLKFRRGLTQAQREHPESVEARLRTAGTLIVRLIGRDEFKTLHLSDRLLARDLRERVLDWFRTQDVKAGERLWEEVHAFAILLSRLNERSELIRHDLLTVHRLLPVLETCEPQQPPSAKALELLDKILGRDDRLDTLCETGALTAEVAGRVRHVYEALTEGRELTSEISVVPFHEVAT
ncbi:MAG: hypothetical protein KDD11_12145 [Acidobacteria bacterium]|nr:hypothetical protein [Acidobacteriota bacterium]